MPPSRDYKIEFDRDWLDLLEAHLGLSGPVTIKINLLKYDHRVTQPLRGLWDCVRRVITLHIHNDIFGASPLRYVKRDILETLLHEYRHAYQQDNWSRDAFADERRCEADAIKWSNEVLDDWPGLFRIRPVSHSNLSRLGAAERRVR